MTYEDVIAKSFERIQNVAQQSIDAGIQIGRRESAARIAELERERAEFEADAKRYRWLREFTDVRNKQANGVPWVVWIDPGERVPTLVPINGGHLDIAIDAQLSALIATCAGAGG